MSILTKFGFRNFRNFKNLVEFEFAPITILTGPNNSGKSSITKGILLLKENMENNILSIKLDCTGSAKSLGNFKNIISRDSESDIIEFGFTYEVDESLGLSNISMDNEQIISNQLFVTLKYMNQDKLPHVSLPGIIPEGRLNFDPPGLFQECSISNEIGKLLFKLEGTDQYDEHLDRTYLLTLNIEYIFSQLVRENRWSKESNLLFEYHLPDDAPLNKDINSFLESIEREALKLNFTNSECWPNRLDDYEEVLGLEGGELYLSLQEIIQNLLEKSGRNEIEIGKYRQNYDLLYRQIYTSYKKFLEINPFNYVRYIPAERAYLSRVYIASSDSFLSNIFNLLREDKIYLDLEFLNKYLRRFNIGDSMELESDEGSFYKIFIVKAGSRTLLADMGYGLTQLIPLLLFASIKKQNGFQYQEQILVEEPELNLHPKFQSLLADFFIDAYKSMGKRFLIETHSEYLIRKMQYHVANGSYGEKEVLIYYLASKDDPEEITEQPVRRIRILKDGSLSDIFGKGFYDESIRLQLELLQIKNKN